MRFIHTADWHLGRLFHGMHLTGEQAAVLEQLIRIVQEMKPDAVLVAGDIYDRAVPPPEAVELLDEVLSRIVIGLKTPVIMIAGNHDSPGRLQFASRLLAGQKLFVAGSLQAECVPVELGDEHGPVHVYAIPYAEPATIRAALAMGEDGAALDHDSAMRAVLSRIRCGRRAGVRTIVVAHAFVAGGQACESERPLSVGGAGTVDSGCFSDFSYVALGHLHRPQSLPDGATHYAGSLLKYSFEEADQPKSVALVEMGAQGVCRRTLIPLLPRREVRRISGLLADLLTAAPPDAARQDYLEVTLLDEGPVTDAMSRLRAIYPNAAEIKRVSAPAGSAAAPPRLDHRRNTDLELFRSFYKHVTSRDLQAAQERAYIEVVDEMHRREREAAAG